MVVSIRGKVLRWGNTFGVRIKKADLEAAGWAVGQHVSIHDEGHAEGIDLSHLPVLRGDGSAGARHAEILAREKGLDWHADR